MLDSSLEASLVGLYNISYLFPFRIRHLFDFCTFKDSCLFFDGSEALLEVGDVVEPLSASGFLLYSNLGSLLATVSLVLMFFLRTHHQGVI